MQQHIDEHGYMHQIHFFTKMQICYYYLSWKNRGKLQPRYTYAEHFNMEISGPHMSRADQLVDSCEWPCVTAQTVTDINSLRHFWPDTLNLLGTCSRIRFHWWCTCCASWASSVPQSHQKCRWPKDAHMLASASYSMPRETNIYSCDVKASQQRCPTAAISAHQRNGSARLA